MRLHHLRSATLVVEWRGYRVLVDPLLAAAGTMMPFRWLARPRRRNPTVPLPPNTNALLGTVTHALVTHCRRGHVDHLDGAGIRWLRDRRTPVFCAASDAPWLSRRGLQVVPLAGDAQKPFLDGMIRRIPCRHGHGWIAQFMANGSGYFIDVPGEPTLYISADTVLTSDVRAALRDLRPDITIVAAGSAQLEVGNPILMTLEEILELIALAPGVVLANHLEALDHCPTTRRALLEAARARGLGRKLRIPADGETVDFTLPLA
jgi:L-ascorbate metabolism protein UlaG (beta-lactamase superfamily)